MTSPAEGYAGRGRAALTGLAVAAGLIAVGNVLSSILGQVRNSVIAHLFADSVASSAYVVASAVPNTLYDFLVGGLVSAALVPVFSELAEHDSAALSDVASTMFTLISAVMLGMIGVIWVAAPLLGQLLTSSNTVGAAMRPLTVTLIRWMAPALLFMALSGLLTGLSQARRQFLIPALAISLFNVGMIASALLLSTRLSVRSLAVGMIVGAAAQVALLTVTARGLQLRPRWQLRHPAIRQILRLYAPIMVGIGFSTLGTTVDRRLASGVAGGATAVMFYATTLIQFGMGVITSAISLAALPTLSRQGVDPDNLTAYRQTLALSLKSVLVLIIPAAVGLGVLARPIVRLLFEGGNFSSAAGDRTALALCLYVPSMIAAAVDQPLIFAFYARKNTLLPNLVQGVAIATYLVVAFALVRPLGMYGLILGNVAQWTVHALVMLLLTERRLAAICGQRLGEALIKGLAASGAMGVVVYSTTRLLGTSATTGQALVQVVVGGAAGVASYAIFAHLVRLEAFALVRAGLGRRLRRPPGTSGDGTATP